MKVMTIWTADGPTSRNATAGPHSQIALTMSVLPIVNVLAGLNPKDLLAHLLALQHYPLFCKSIHYYI